VSLNKNINHIPNLILHSQVVADKHTFVLISIH